MPFVARLPQRLLAQGALATVGHVERTWGYSFLWKGVGLQAQAFELALLAMLAGLPIGMAMESFGRRALDLNLELVETLDARRLSRAVDSAELAGLWADLRWPAFITLAALGAAVYVLGSPAVRAYLALRRRARADAAGEAPVREPGSAPAASAGNSPQA